MSMEAQYYEAKRRQRVIERSQSLRARNENHKQAPKPQRQSFDVPLRLSLPWDKPSRCTCTPMEMVLLTDFDQISYERGRDIYARPKTTATSRPSAAPKQYFRNARLPNRFTSTEYRQQW